MKSAADLQIPDNLTRLKELWEKESDFEGLHESKQLVMLNWAYTRVDDVPFFRILPFPECVSLCAEIATIARQCARLTRQDTGLQTVMDAMSAMQVEFDEIEAQLNGHARRDEALATGMEERSRDCDDSTSTPEWATDEIRGRFAPHRLWHSLSPFFLFDTSGTPFREWVEMARVRSVGPLLAGPASVKRPLSESVTTDSPLLSMESHSMLKRMVSAVQSRSSITRWYFDRSGAKEGTSAGTGGASGAAAGTEGGTEDEVCGVPFRPRVRFVKRPPAVSEGVTSLDGALRCEVRDTLFPDKLATFASAVTEKRAIHRSDDELSTYIRANKIDLQSALRKLHPTVGRALLHCESLDLAHRARALEEALLKYSLSGEGQLTLDEIVELTNTLTDDLCLTHCDLGDP